MNKILAGVAALIVLAAGFLAMKKSQSEVALMALENKALNSSVRELEARLAGVEKKAEALAAKAGEWAPEVEGLKAEVSQVREAVSSADADKKLILEKVTLLGGDIETFKITNRAEAMILGRRLENLKMSLDRAMESEGIDKINLGKIPVETID